jgi:hypothetical protein
MPEEWVALLRDIERRLADLSARVDLADANIRADIQGIRVDIKRLQDSNTEFVPMTRYLPIERLFWAALTAIVVGLIGGLIAVVTR